MSQPKAKLSAGAVKLALSVKRLGGVVRVGRELGVSHGTLRAQIAGTSKPTKTRREVYRDVFGIDPADWEHAAGVTAQPSTKEQPRAMKAAPTDDVKQIAIDVLSMLRGQLAAAEPDDVPVIAGAIAQQSRILARATGQYEVTQAQIIRSPYFRAAMKVLEDALEPYPDAVRAVAQAFEGLDGR